MTRHPIRPAATIVLGLATWASGFAASRAQDPAPPAPAATAKPAEVAKPQLVAQRFATRKARLAADLARIARDQAELAVQEYEEVTYPRDLAAAEAEITLARTSLTRAEDRVEWSRKLSNQYRTEQTRDKLALEQARFDLEQARTERDILTKYTRDKTLKALRAEAAKAEADRSAKEAAWERERAEEDRLADRLDVH